MSRDYEEDQKNELEALESIYFEELEILDEEKRNKFKINVYTEGFREEQDGLCCDLVFTYTAKYPDEKPIVEIEDEINFESDIKKKVLDGINSCIEENLGTEMIFSIVGSTQELLNSLFDQIKIEREEQRERKEREIEEIELKKFEGTRVTVETFMNWRNDFEAEMGIAEKRAKENETNRKLTGRELFLKDQSLLDSDIRFLTENGDSIENVKIDESLFQNLDLEEDLPSGDESDDPDWKPS
ncbi:RWD domain-containing protein 1 [Chironomus tepperi]|uniref:RWD domain-containing protein 1 n=1 Tax=Chironomus tepperi TaxID=113505 RepID=UPI00391F2980